MKNIRKCLFWAVSPLILIAFSSCIGDKFKTDNVKGTNWEPSIAVPLMNSDLTVYNVLQKIDDNNVVVIDSSSRFIALVYDGEATFADLDSFIVFPSPSISVAGAPIPAAPTGNVVVSGTADFTGSPSSVEMYQLLLQSGTMTVNIDNSALGDEIDVVLSIPEFKSGGTSFSQTFNVAANQTGNFNVQLNGYEFDFTKTLQGYNEIQYDITFSRPNYNGASGSLGASFDFSNLQNDRLMAYFGQKSFSLGDNEIELNIFGNTVGDGVFRLDSPLVKLEFDNSIGVPIDVDLSSMQTENTETGTQFPFTFTPASLSTLSINSSTDPNNPNAFTSETYDRTEVAQFEDIVNGNKKIFKYNPSVSINSAGKDTNFLNGNSELKIRAEVELPLQGYAYGFDIVDTVPFDGLDLSQGTEVTGVLFKTGVENGFPIDLRFQLYFMDSTNTILDSLYQDFDDNLMESGAINAAGEVITPTLKIKEVEYNRTRALALSNATQIMLKAASNSEGANATLGANSQVIKLYDYYKVNVRLSMRVDLSIQP